MSRKLALVEMWAAWSDKFGFVANSIGVHPEADLIDARIVKASESPQAVRDLRRVRVTIHIGAAGVHQHDLHL